MRKLSTGRGGGERVGMLSFEVAALMSRAASLWRALEEDQLARLRGEGVRLEGVRRLVADDDSALLALAVAEMAGACGDISCAVARLAGRCADPLLRRFDELFSGLIAGGAGADSHGLRYAAAKKMDRKARKMQRLVAATGLLCQEIDVLAELEQGARLRRVQFAPGEAARRVARQRQEVDRLRTASLWNRSLDYAVRLLGRSLFTIVARIIQVFDLQPKKIAMNDYAMVSPAGARLSFSWSNSFVGSTNSLVYPSDFPVDAPKRSTGAAKSGKAPNGDVRRFLLSRSQSLKQLKWPVRGKHLIGCMVSGSKSPNKEGWVHGGHDLPLSFSYVSSNNDDFSGSYQTNESDRHSANRKLSTSVFECSSHDVLENAPETTLGAAALASHYANLVVFAEKLAISPRHICPDERDALYGMLTDSIRASLRARLRPPSSAARKKGTPCDRVLAAGWADTVQGILGWLAPVAHNTVRWRSERSFEQRNVGSGTSVLLLQTLHFADRDKTEDAIIELLVGLNYLWRYGTQLSAKPKLESVGGDVYHDRADYIG
ncbi:unnamed protein product [Triticum turgidum subsp. durum]|uniref:DUF668 domain-containing protein n=1 Tax=Triticum turgidum subsp. durum TaxID=4567 RepID=A0A9R0X4G1_TRITD|nr:unnamed protein product [Triticum turgidum subsp. durum]